MDWSNLLERDPPWLLAIALTVAASVLGFSAWTDKCFRFFGFQFGQCEGVLPKGTVIAFDLATGCPPDWQADDDYRGRVIIGAGLGKGLADRPLRMLGGEEKHTLTIGEMPVHSHKLDTLQSVVPGTQPGERFSGWDKAQGDQFPPWNASTAPAGGGEAHNIMPPFISLYLCRKS